MKEIFSIDKYVIVTLPRSIRRQYLMIGNLVAMGVKYEDIVFYPAVDARDYSYDMQLVAKAAAADGCMFLSQFALGIRSRDVKQSAGNIALFWTWAKVLRQIMDSGKTVLLSWDDRFLMVPFHQLENHISDLYQRHEPFYLAQLRLRDYNILDLCGHEEFSLPWHEEKKHTTTYLSVFDALVGASFPNSNELLFQQGIFGYDETMVLSPEGAAWLLEQMLGMEDYTAALREWQYREGEDEGLTTENLDPEMRSRLNNDNWLCWGIRDAIGQALEDGKGIYSPRHHTFRFVDEILLSGSDVMWDPNIPGNIDTSVAPPIFSETLL